MSIHEIRVPLNNVVIKTKNNKSGNPFYYFEVLEPQWKFLQVNNNPRVESLLAEFAKTQQPINLNALLQKDSFVIDDNSFQLQK
jgi:hypothetical protein